MNDEIKKILSISFRQPRRYKTLFAEWISRHSKTIQDFPTVVKSVVSNLKTGSKTEMEFSNVKYDIKLKDIFTERYLRRPPREAIR